MPPRKRAKASAASTPLAESQPKTPVESGPTTQSHDQTSPQNENENLINDPWTNDQETQLFKSMIRWKPTGIWNKLHQLYDLNALDERENAYAFSSQPDPFDPADRDAVPEFELPEDDFGELMWDRRFPPSDKDATSSPPFISTAEDKKLYRPGLGLLRGLSEVAKEDAEIRASPSIKARGGARGGRAAAKGGRVGKAAQSARSSKAQSAVSESAGEEEDEEESVEESEESEDEIAPSSSKGARGGKRGRPARRGRKR